MSDSTKPTKSKKPRDSKGGVRKTKKEPKPKKDLAPHLDLNAPLFVPGNIITQVTAPTLQLINFNINAPVFKPVSKGIQMVNYPAPSFNPLHGDFQNRTSHQQPTDGYKNPFLSQKPLIQQAQHYQLKQSSPGSSDSSSPSKVYSLDLMMSLKS